MQSLKRHKLHTATGDVHVVVAGDLSQRTLVCVHGLPGTSADFAPLARDITQHGLGMVAIDMPGFGKTPTSTFASVAPADRAVFVHKVAGALGLSRYAVAGHSFGGQVAILTAALFPDAVDALVLLSSVGPRRHRALPAPPTWVKGAALVSAKAGGRLLARAESIYRRMGWIGMRGFDADMLAFHARLIGTLDIAELQQACTRVRAPTFLLGADDDPLVEPAVADATAAALVKVPLVSRRRVKTGGHNVHRSHGPAVAAWLSSVPPPSQGARKA